MNVASWYDQGVRLSVPASDAPITRAPAGMSASVAAINPRLVEKALAYEADIAEMKARYDAFPVKEGTMVGILRDKITTTEAMLKVLVESAREAEDATPVPGQRREAYYCNDYGCWIAEQYFCDDTGCWIIGDGPLFDDDADAAKVVGKVVSSAPAEKTVVQEGIFAPAVKLTAQAMGRKELNAFRAKVIQEHTKVISAFVDTSDSKFGQIALKSLFEAADKDGNGTLDKEEVKAALQALGFTFIEDKQIDRIFKKADKDKNEVIDFEEFVKEAPKALRVNLVKLARENGHDLGFLA